MTVKADWNSPKTTNPILADIENMREHMWYTLIMSYLLSAGLIPGWDLYRVNRLEGNNTSLEYYFRGPKNVELRLTTRNQGKEPEVGWNPWLQWPIRIDRKILQDEGKWEKFDLDQAIFGWTGINADILSTITWA